jgi:branched-chain amino acid transport system substrate-binding protein
MLKRVGAVVAVAAAFAVAVSTTAWGSAKAPARASASAGATTKVKCGKTVTIGVAYPATGDAASIGVLQYHWAKYAQKRWNKSHKLKIRLLQGDTQLPNTAQALSVAHTFAGNKKVLAITGPAGSQEVQDTVAVYKKGGLAAVSGSATRVALTRAKPGAPRETPKGYFFRTVPTDGQQGDRDAAYMTKTLKKKRIYIIDDEEAYSQGLADQVQGYLKKVPGTQVTRDHVSQTVSDFSSLITRIPQNTQVVFLPWQLADKANTFYQQLRAAGKNAIVFGSDGTDAPGVFKATGGYVSGFPVDFSSPVLKAYTKSHGGNGETFGLPSYTATWMNATAIQMACKAGHGKTTRKAVRMDLQKVKLSKKASLLGFPVHFLTKNTGSYQGAGDMASPANFAIYKIQSNGTYVRVG